MRLLSYSILYYNLHFFGTQNFLYFYNLKISLREQYYCNRCALNKKSVKFTLSIAVHTDVMAKNHIWLVAT